MKKILLLLFALSIVAFFSNTAFCGQGIYVGAGVGGTLLNDSEVTDTVSPGEKIDFEFDNGMGAYLAWGCAFKYIRVEGEVSYQVNEFDETVRSGTTYDLSGDTSALALLANFYLDFTNSSSFTPFITAGAGIAKIETAEFYVPGAGFNAFSNDDTVFAYQAGAGISYAISDKTVVDCKYRYFATDEPSFDTVDTEFASHNVYLGVRLFF